MTDRYAQGWQDAVDIVEHVLAEWRETMRGDAKYEAVARGISVEVTATLGNAAPQPLTA